MHIADMHKHERLECWKRAVALSLEIAREIGSHRSTRHAGLLNQIDRSVASIPANIAEGAGQSTNAQFARFLDVAIGSTQESHSHLVLARGLRLFTPEQSSKWLDELVAIRRMLNGLSRHMRNEPRLEISPRAPAVD